MWQMIVSFIFGAIVLAAGVTCATINAIMWRRFGSPIGLLVFEWIITVIQYALIGVLTTMVTRQLLG